MVQGSDTVYCYSLDDARKIALKFSELSECRELLNISDVQIDNLRSMLKTHENIEARLNAEITMKTQLIEYHISNKEIFQDQIRVLKRKNIAVMVGAGLVVGGVLFVTIK